MSETEPTITVASQVSIPTESSPKRRASSPAVPSSSKRQRLSPPAPEHRASPPHAQPPTRRALSPTSKNRSKRMFGNLLTTISKFQSELDSPRAKGASRKRRELEEKGRERARLQEEGEPVKPLVDGAKWREWERECLRTKHSNMRSASKFLVTKAKPYIYYLPYELRAEDERQLEQRARDVERQIEREERALDERHAKDEDNEAERRRAEGQDDGDVAMTAGENTAQNGNRQIKYEPSHDEDVR